MKTGTGNAPRGSPTSNDVAERIPHRSRSFNCTARQRPVEPSRPSLPGQVLVVVLERGEQRSPHRGQSLNPEPQSAIGHPHFKADLDLSEILEAV